MSDADKTATCDIFLNLAAAYFEHAASKSHEDIEVQAYANNARNLVAAASHLDDLQARCDRYKAALENIALLGDAGAWLTARKALEIEK